MLWHKSYTCNHDRFILLLVIIDWFFSPSLKSLSLKDNCLSDAGVRHFTLPWALFQKWTWKAFSVGFILESKYNRWKCEAHSQVAFLECFKSVRYKNIIWSWSSAAYERHNPVSSTRCKWSYGLCGSEVLRAILNWMLILV